MQVLSRHDEDLLDRLMRLAGGDATLVMQALDPARRHAVSLDTVIEEILAQRDPAVLRALDPIPTLHQALEPVHDLGPEANPGPMPMD